MQVDLIVPEVAESIHEVQILAWKKKRSAPWCVPAT